MINRAHHLLDAHPRLRYALHLALVIPVVLGFLACWAIGWAAIAVAVAGIFIGAVLLASTPATAIESFSVGWIPFLTIAAWVGALGGLAFRVRQLLMPSRRDHRTRTVLARDLVAQAVVADRIGSPDIDLDLAILNGGDIDWTLPSRIGPTAPFDNLSDRLTVMLANPSLRDAHYLDFDQQYEWYADITRTAEEIIIYSAASGNPVQVTTTDLINDAASKARRILDATDAPTLEAIERELRLAGTMRSDRFKALLGPLPVPVPVPVPVDELS